MNNINRIASFSVDHDFITTGIYVSRIDGDITTYDLRTRKPNCDCYMDNLTMHSVEHMFATYIRNSAIKDDVIYFGPMGCQTGFYLLVRNADNGTVFNAVCETLNKIINHTDEIFGKSRKECGNYKNLDLESAKAECREYLIALGTTTPDFKYPTE